MCGFFNIWGGTAPLPSLPRTLRLCIWYATDSDDRISWTSPSNRESLMFRIETRIETRNVSCCQSWLHCTKPGNTQSVRQNTAIVWSWNIPWLGWWYERVFLNIAKKDIVFCWVPSHTGIKGNAKADLAAKSALDLPRAKVWVPYTDFKHLISQYIFSTWQDDWNGAVMNKLHSVKPFLGDWQSSYRQCRKDEVVLCRARIGHTHLTHSYILRKDPPPLCEHCQCILTVRHILVQCNHFARERKDIFGRRDVESLSHTHTHTHTHTLNSMNVFKYEMGAVLTKWSVLSKTNEVTLPIQDWMR